MFKPDVGLICKSKSVLKTGNSKEREGEDVDKKVEKVETRWREGVDVDKKVESFPQLAGWEG